jgi:hypothetical protein
MQATVKESSRIKPRTSKKLRMNVKTEPVEPRWEMAV